MYGNIAASATLSQRGLVVNLRSQFEQVMYILSLVTKIAIH
jgi:hypothetical protein